MCLPCLLAQLQDTALDQAEELFRLHSLLDLPMLLKNSAMDCDQEQVDELIVQFREHADRVQEVCRLLFHVAPSITLQINAGHTETSLEIHWEQLLTALTTLVVYPTSKIAKENFETFSDVWTTLLSDVSQLNRDIGVVLNNYRSRELEDQQNYFLHHQHQQQHRNHMPISMPHHMPPPPLPPMHHYEHRSHHHNAMMNHHHPNMNPIVPLNPYHSNGYNNNNDHHHHYAHHQAYGPYDQDESMHYGEPMHRGEAMHHNDMMHHAEPMHRGDMMHHNEYASYDYPGQYHAPMGPPEAMMMMPQYNHPPHIPNMGMAGGGGGPSSSGMGTSSMMDMSNGTLPPHRPTSVQINPEVDVVEIAPNNESTVEIEDNDIVRKAKAMSAMAMAMFQFTRGEGELKTTQDLFTQAEFFADEANKLYKIVRHFTYQVRVQQWRWILLQVFPLDELVCVFPTNCECALQLQIPAGMAKKELLDCIDQVPNYVQQLQFAVKNVTVGKTATFTKVDSVIQESKSLMQVITRVVAACMNCANKVCAQGLSISTR